MLFKGTDTLGPGFVDREVEGVGGRTNAGTSLDYTYYYMLLPSPRAARGIEVLADMAFNSSFDPTELGREREVVFEEVRVGEDNPRSFIGRRLYENAFAGYPYGYPVLGDPAALRAATRESLPAPGRPGVRHPTVNVQVASVVPRERLALRYRITCLPEVTPTRVTLHSRRITVLPPAGAK